MAFSSIKLIWEMILVFDFTDRAFGTLENNEFDQYMVKHDFPAFHATLVRDVPLVKNVV
jgi:hypothetical protein